MAHGESLVVSGNFSVSALVPFQTGTANLVIGNSTFTVPGSASPLPGYIGYSERLDGGPAVTGAEGTREIIQDNTVFYLGDTIESL